MNGLINDPSVDTWFSENYRSIAHLIATAHDVQRMMMLTPTLMVPDDSPVFQHPGPWSIHGYDVRPGDRWALLIENP